MRRVRFIDMLLVLIPGVLCAWGAYGTSNSDQSDVRSSFPLTFLFAVCAYVAGYALARLVAPSRPVRLVLLMWMVPLTGASLFVGGVSLAAGYAVFAYICAPLIGFVVSLLVQPAERSPEVTA